ncbi:MAG: thioredoxin domain-containing protein [Tepidiformaceae bacterium]
MRHGGLVALASGLLVLAAACGGDEGDGGAAATRPPATAAATRTTSATAAARPAAGAVAGLGALAIPAGLADGRFLGAPSALVTLTVFEDFQCPFCLRFTAFERRFGAQVAVGHGVDLVVASAVHLLGCGHVSQCRG